MIGVLAGAFMLSVVLVGAPPVAAQESTANVEVRVWQSVSNALSIYVSARPEGGDWGALGTIPLPLDDGYSSSGNYRYGDITVEGVEVRVWQSVSDARSIYISARPEGGDWNTLGTIPLPLDDGYSSSGNYRYGDITVAVPLPAPDAPLSASCRLEQRSATWDVEWSALDTDGYARRSLGGEQWVPTFSADWGRGEVFGGRNDMLLLDATMPIVVAHAGWVWFEVGGDDGFELYVNNEVVLDDWNNGSARRWGRFQWMQPGIHELRLMYYEWAGRAELLFDTDQTVLAWSEASGCDKADMARLSAESSNPIVFNGIVVPPADPGPIVVLLQGIDSHSSCGPVHEGWSFLGTPRRLYGGYLRADVVGPEDNMFKRRQSIVDAIQSIIPGEWESNVVGFSYSGLYEDCVTGDQFSGKDTWFGNYNIFPIYSPLDTCEGVRTAAENLGELLESIHSQEPDRNIVIFGHSLGGMVAAYYAAELATPQVLRNIKSVMTVDSPLLGNFIVSPFSGCEVDPRSWQDIRGESDVVPTIASIQGSNLASKFINLNSTVIGDSLIGGRTVILECGFLGLIGHSCGFYDPVALQEIVDVVRR